MINVADPQITEEEISLVTETIRSKALVEGKNARILEKEFANFVGAKNAICTTNGTSALHLALEALDIPPGAEIITPAFTFIASANAISFGGNVPIFADLDPKTYNIDPEEIEKLITPKTKAILPVHIFGLPADMKAILDIATDHDLIVIEDACQAHGASIDGKHVGSFGEVGCFSFYATKNMISGEGGMIVTDNDELALKMRSLKNHGRGAQGGYHHEYVAYNFRLADPLAAIGLVQLRKLPLMLKRREENAKKIRKTIDSLSGIRNQEIPKGFIHGHYICAPVVDSPKFTPNQIISELKNYNIGSRQIYSIPCHQQHTYLDGIKKWRWSKFVTYPDYSKVSLPNTELIAATHFEIPIHAGLTEVDVQMIQEALVEIIKE
ncbi:MAG: DegT/DnrJ/EryC1/StrS family aminotransferase [Candidatus Heimdallarchaeota archaeon]|nr:DegT/DnrJ/EryC1/StrS family aminotransferase [Candidatus Heimdallarchaeota archaeon]